MHPLLRRARDFEAELIQLRRDLHRHPELSFREVRTAAIAAERVEALGGTLTYGHTPEGAWEVCAVLKCDT